MLKKGNKAGYISFVLLCIVLSIILSGCSQDLNQNEMEKQSLVTGKVVGQELEISTGAVTTTTTIIPANVNSETKSKTPINKQTEIKKVESLATTTTLQNDVSNKVTTTTTSSSTTTTIPTKIISTSTTTTTIPTTTTMSTTTTLPEQSTNPKVNRIVDGDTIELQSGERVRLLGINTPEKGQPYYEEATNRLKDLIEGKNVVLESDVDDKDQYGRILRHVFINNENINIKMVEEGYATVYVFPPNVKYEDELKKAWEGCLNNEVNLCKSPDGNDKCDSSCIGISYFHWNAEGNDCDNLNDEYVKFQNSCESGCDMSKWTIKDESSREPYLFPEFNLENWKSVTLYTGCGTDTNTELYWCSSGKSCNSIWNNNADTLYLRNSEGELVLSYSYP